MEQVLNFLLSHWISLSVVSIVFWICYKYAWKPYKSLKRLGLPGPMYVPFVGNVGVFFNRDNTHLRITEACKKYGDVSATILLGTPVIYVKDLDIMKEIMIKEFNKFNARRDLITFPPERITSNFMSVVSGEAWANQRHTLSPAFSASRLKHVLKLMNDSCDTLIDKKLRAVADKDEPINIHEWLKKFTLETILSSAFGIKSETQMSENDHLANLAKKAMEPRKLLISLIFLPLGQFILKFFPDPLGIGELANVAQHIIDTRTRSEVKKRDLLQLMLDSRNQSELKKLTDDEIIAQSVLFLLAGYETSSTTLGFLCYHLAVDSHVQDKIQEEIDEKWSEEEEFPSYEAINSMTYLEMTVQEALRMYPPGHLTQRFCGEDCTIKGVNFIKDTMIFFPVYAIHRDPKYYPDPEKFDPLRFTTEEKAKRDQFAYLPFGQGPRNCIGSRFALMEMKIVLVRMLKEFRLEVCSKTQIPIKVTSTNLLTPSKDGVWVHVKSRKKAN